MLVLTGICRLKPENKNSFEMLISNLGKLQHFYLDVLTEMILCALFLSKSCFINFEILLVFFNKAHKHNT